MRPTTKARAIGFVKRLHLDYIEGSVFQQVAFEGARYPEFCLVPKVFLFNRFMYCNR
jgi:hypothetical protein